MSYQTREDVYEEVSIYLYGECVPRKDDVIPLDDGEGSLS